MGLDPVRPGHGLDGIMGSLRVDLPWTMSRRP